MGIGGAAVQPTTLAVITNVFPPRERGRAIGVWAGTAGIAVAGRPAGRRRACWSTSGGASVFLIGVPVALLGLRRRRCSSCPSRKDPTPGRLDLARRAAVDRGAGRAGLRDHPRRLRRTAGRRPACSSRCSAGWSLLVAVRLARSGASTHPALDVTLFRNPAFSAAAARAGAELLRAAWARRSTSSSTCRACAATRRCRAVPRSSRSRSAWRVMAPRSSGWPRGSAPRCWSVPPGSCWSRPVASLRIQLLGLASPAVAAGRAGPAPCRGSGMGSGHGAGDRVDHVRGAAREGRCGRGR